MTLQRIQPLDPADNVDFEWLLKWEGIAPAQKRLVNKAINLWEVEHSDDMEVLAYVAMEAGFFPNGVRVETEDGWEEMPSTHDISAGFEEPYSKRVHGPMGEAEYWMR